MKKDLNKRLRELREDKGVINPHAYFWQQAKYISIGGKIYFNKFHKE